MLWIGGHLSEVVAYERWSHMEVRLFLKGKDKGDQVSNLPAVLFFYWLNCCILKKDSARIVHLLQ